jgi:hypothetical protein
MFHSHVDPPYSGLNFNAPLLPTFSPFSKIEAITMPFRIGTEASAHERSHRRGLISTWLKPGVNACIPVMFAGKEKTGIVQNA